jgi:hypothetical protein
MKMIDKDNLIQTVKEYVKENKKPYIAYGHLLEKVRLKYPKTEKSKVEQLLGVLKSEGKLEETRIRRERLFFPLKMVELYVKSDEL